MVTARLQIKTKSGLLLVDSGVIQARRFPPAGLGIDYDTTLTARPGGFSGPVSLNLVRRTTPHPQHGAGRNGFTRAYDLTLSAAPVLNPATPLKNQPLSVFLVLGITKTGSFSTDPFTLLARAPQLKMDTLS